MSEKCPLSGGEHAIEIPAVCYSHCQELWDDATVRGATSGDYDNYRDFGGDCPHHEIEFSSESLIAPNTTDIRDYVVVDECSNCGIEVGEQGYEFHCPHN